MNCTSNYSLTFRNEDNWNNTSLTDILSVEEEVLFVNFFFISKKKKLNDFVVNI